MRQFPGLVYYLYLHFRLEYIFEISEQDTIFVTKKLHLDFFLGKQEKCPGAFFKKEIFPSSFSLNVIQSGGIPTIVSFRPGAIISAFIYYF